METLYTIFKQSSGICTDTRKVTDGCLFVALKGANFDGNLFISEALNQGAIAAVTDSPEIANSLNSEQVVLVKDCLVTLQSLASYHRDQLSVPIIGITGTNGKTTTKELCHTVLNSQYNCYATKGNLNNHIGVPLSILEVNNQHDFAIIEMGANHLGEIAELCLISKPNIGIITNIGTAHLEGFGSFENIVKTKNELYKYIIQTNGSIIFNLDDSILSKLVNGYMDCFTYSRSDSFADLSYGLVEKQLYAGIQWKEKKVISQLFGSYNAENLACAFALGMKLNIDSNRIINSIESYIPGNNRSQLLKKGTNQLILDAYNANPSSMSSAVSQFLNVEDEHPKILILGDMLELGTYSAMEHQKILDHLIIQNIAFDHCYLVGEEFSKCEVSQNNISFFRSVNELKELFKKQKVQSHLIFLKGSRGIRLEELIDLF